VQGGACGAHAPAPVAAAAAAAVGSVWPVKIKIG